jgi:hypothetical protein
VKSLSEGSQVSRVRLAGLSGLARFKAKALSKVGSGQVRSG